MNQPDSPRYSISKAGIETCYGNFNIWCFSWGPQVEDNILCLFTSFEPPLLMRIHSSCCTGEVFRSLDCDCHDQLEQSLYRVQKEGGAIFYLFQEGRSAGIFTKIKAMGIAQLQHKDTVEVNDSLGIRDDPRSYDRVVDILHDLKIGSVRLMTNNPAKIEVLLRSGIAVRRESLEIPPTAWTAETLRSKKHKLGHLLTKTFGHLP